MSVDFDVLADSIRGYRHGNSSEPLTGDLGDDLDLFDEVNTGEIGFVDAIVESLACERFNPEIGLVGVEQVLGAEAVTRVIPLGSHGHTERGQGLLN